MKIKQNVDLKQFPPILRVLLTTDGTVTKTLEAYYWEPVIVDKLAQKTIQIPFPVEALCVHAGESILIRQVRLRGSKSGHIYVFASSQICISSLPSPLSEDLLTGEIGIGELILECGLETYREIKKLGVLSEPCYAHIDKQNQLNLQQIVYRSYRIMIAKKPAILVTEKFPLRLYETIIP